MHDHQDEHDHRNLEVTEEPMDAAQESLSDALRASFRILKGILMVLVLLYLFSNVRRVESHEEALHLRLGALLPTIHESGLVWAFPFPIDEIIPLPTKKSNDLIIDSHTFARTPDERGKPLAFISRGSQGLDPAVDGALLTADAGLVHVRWKVTYKINDVTQFISGIGGDVLGAAEALIKTYVETVGVEVASEMTAEQIVRTELERIQSEIHRRVNLRLAAIDSGISVTLLEAFEPTPPIQIRDAFDRTQRAENNKQSKIRQAEQQRTEMLSKAVGPGYTEVVALLDELDAARSSGTPTSEFSDKLDDLLVHRVKGEAGRKIRDAEAYRSVVVRRMESDVNLYRTLLPEFRRTPELLVARLWEQTRQKIMDNSGVTKFYRPQGSEIRLEIPLDPEQSQLEEKERLESQGFDVKKLRPAKLTPIFPDLEQ